MLPYMASYTGTVPITRQLPRGSKPVELGEEWLYLLIALADPSSRHRRIPQKPIQVSGLVAVGRDALCEPRICTHTLDLEEIRDDLRGGNVRT